MKFKLYHWGLENIVNTLRKTTLRYLEQQLEDYQTIDIQIAQRRLVIDNPWKESNTNVGGGRGSYLSKEPETITFKRLDDPVLNNLFKLKKSVADAIQIYMRDDQQYKIYRLKFNSANYRSWEEVGEQLFISKALIYKKRYTLLKVLADIEGIKE